MFKMSSLREQVGTDPPSRVLEAAPPLDQAGTESHALATAEHDEVGAVQEDHFEEQANDLGWNSKEQDIPQPLIGGLSNEELVTLMRRFNKVSIPSSTVLILRSKYSTSKRFPKLPLADSTSTLQTKMTFLPQR
jgi:hypothetical protein